MRQHISTSFICKASFEVHFINTMPCFWANSKVQCNISKRNIGPQNFNPMYNTSVFQIILAKVWEFHIVNPWHAWLAFMCSYPRYILIKRLLWSLIKLWISYRNNQYWFRRGSLTTMHLTFWYITTTIDLHFSLPLDHIAQQQGMHYKSPIFSPDITNWTLDVMSVGLQIASGVKIALKCTQVQGGCTLSAIGSMDLQPLDDIRFKYESG